MEPIPYYFDNVRRCAMVLKPKKPFLDWLSQIDPESGEFDILSDTDVYLLPDFETLEELEIWLADNYHNIFEDQLNNWYTDESLWVQNRTFQLFKEWFEYTLHTMVWDTLETDIDKV